MNPRGYYEKLLWFIVNDSVLSEDDEEITSRYLRAWDDIWLQTKPTGKPGRPRIDESARLRKMLALMNTKKIGHYAAARKVVENDDTVIESKRPALIKKLVRAYDGKIAPDSKAIPNKGEKYVAPNTFPDGLDIETLYQDAQTIGKKEEKKVIAAFLSDIEKLFLEL